MKKTLIAVSVMLVSSSALAAVQTADGVVTTLPQEDIFVAPYDPYVGAFTFGISKKNIDFSSKTTVNAGAGDYAESHKLNTELTNAVIGYDYDNENIFWSAKLKLPFTSSGSKYSYCSGGGGCSGAGVSTDMTGYEVDVGFEYNVSNYTPGIVGRVSAVGGINVSDYESDKFNNANQNKSVELSNRELYGGVGYITDIDERFYIDLKGLLRYGNTDYSYSGNTTSGLAITETGDTESRFVGYALKAEAIFVVTKEINLTFGYEYADTLSESRESNKKLSAVSNNVTVSDGSGDNNYGEWKLGLSYQWK